MAAVARTIARARLLALALAALGASLAPAEVAAAETRRAALVRVEVIEADGARVQASRAVWWDGTASVRVQVGGHEHALAVTPSERGRGIAVSVDHARDGAVVADDQQVTSSGRRVVLDHGDTRVVVTVVPTKVHLDVE
ncbi:MAG TPA: hypothetical protein VFG69_04060 [Nannocystaceae bacterium]|nr:hypothetical protein [Nannocystaceae bacterium]